ncbi:yfnA, partial [Symbiodinium sp. CCMP2456]
PVVRVVASEWSSPPQVCTVGATRKALEEGSELPGNLVLCDTPEAASNLQDLWAAYQCVAPLTVALVVKQESIVSSKSKQLESTVFSKGTQCASLVSVGRQGNLRNEVVRVVCSQLSEQDGPVPRRAITTKIPVSSVISKVTVRLLAPQCFRQFVAGVESEDDPRVIISEWAKLLGCPLADLTGGTWERISDKSGSVVVGHLRVSTSLAQKIVNLSGSRALFATRTTFEGSLLKLRRVVDISAFLLSQGWRQVQVITRRKSWTKGNPPEWIFQGLKPDGSPTDQTTWFYADESTQLSVGPVPPRKRAPAEATSIPGPRKRWVDQDGKGTVRTGDVDAGVSQREQQKLKRDVAPGEGPMDWDGDDENPIFHPSLFLAADTQIDEDVDLMDDDELATRADKRLLDELPAEWGFREVGGSGDCAFRAVAWSLSRAQGKKLEDPEALQREAARLRLLTVGHISKHAARFSESWAADPEETKSDRAGQTASISTFAEYKEAAAGRHFYADGIMLQALSERIACPLVIWAWNPELDVWNRSV